MLVEHISPINKAKGKPWSMRAEEEEEKEKGHSGEIIERTGISKDYGRRDLAGHVGGKAARGVVHELRALRVPPDDDGGRRALGRGLGDELSPVCLKDKFVCQSG